MRESKADRFFFFNSCVRKGWQRECSAEAVDYHRHIRPRSFSLASIPSCISVIVHGEGGEGRKERGKPAMLYHGILITRSFPLDGREGGH